MVRSGRSGFFIRTKKKLARRPDGELGATQFLVQDGHARSGERHQLVGHQVDEQPTLRRLRPPWLGGEEFAGPRLGLLQAGASDLPTRSHFTKSKTPESERMFLVSWWPPARSSTSWRCSSGALMGYPAQSPETLPQAHHPASTHLYKLGKGKRCCEADASGARVLSTTGF